MNNVDNQYLSLIKDVLSNGEIKNNRTGIKTYSVFGRSLRFNLAEGFPIITTKKIHWKSVVHELLWFLSGSSNIKYLKENKVRIWDEWADPNTGELGPVYGVQWRKYIGIEDIKYNFTSYTIPLISLDIVTTSPSDGIVLSDWKKLFKKEVYKDYEFPKVEFSWKDYNKFEEDVKTIPGWKLKKEFPTKYVLSNVKGLSFNKENCEWVLCIEEQEQELLDSFNKRLRIVDQIDHIVCNIKNDPESRRIILNAWNPSVINSMKLPPCHMFSQFFVENGKLSCLFYMRSCDVFLGLPFNISSYALLLSMLASVCNLEVGELIWNGGDVHIYENHLDQIKLQLSRNSFDLPKLELNKNIRSMDDFKYEDINLINYQSHDSIKAQVAV